MTLGQYGHPLSYIDESSVSSALLNFVFQVRKYKVCQIQEGEKNNQAHSTVKEPYGYLRGIKPGMQNTRR